MTIQWLSSKRVEGLDADKDTIPVTSLESGYSFTALDTPVEYIWNGVDTWVPIGGGGVDDIVATGGVVTQDGDFKVHTFNANDNFTIQSGSGDVTRLVVAGGGAGGDNNGGGGGAGGLLTDTVSMAVGVFPVVVGAGGLGNSGTPTSGNNSSLDTLTSIGGGSGGGASASSGGSGGGGGNSGVGGSGTVDQGFAGGSGSTLNGGGGGGANEVGANANGGGGDGGDGLQLNIQQSSTFVFYAGGGGGGAQGIAIGQGGQGGGGDGAGLGAGAGVNGTDGLGGGGGGGRTPTGGDGGSGVVIVRYFSPAEPFSPFDISDMRTWYDATDLTTITSDGSNRVSQWRDKQGLNDLDQLTGGDQPLLVSNGRDGKPIIDFATSRWMNTDFGSAWNYPLTVVYICELSANTGTEDIMLNPATTNASNWGLRKNAGADSFSMLSSGGSVTASTTAGAWAYVTMVWNGSSSVFRVNGVEVQTGTTGNGTSNPISLGKLGANAERFGDNKVMHFIAYEKVLTAQELLELENWANDQIN